MPGIVSHPKCSLIGPTELFFGHRILRTAGRWIMEGMAGFVFMGCVLPSGFDVGLAGSDFVA